MHLPHWLVLTLLAVFAYVLWRKFGSRVTGAVTGATK